MKKNVCFLIVLFSMSMVNAEKLYIERPYDPVILSGHQLAPFLGVPVEEMYVYSYHAETDSWEMIPFQIDQRVRLEIGDNNMRHYYVQPNKNDQFEVEDTDPLFDNDDELCFLVRDLGDKASDRSWIENKESLGYDRLELKIIDPENPVMAAYCYLYRSPTLDMPETVKNRYKLKFDPQNHVVESEVYSIRISQETGLINDVIIKPPYGNGVDIFDTQKLRINGLFKINFTIPLGRDGVPSGTENFLYVYDNEKYLSYTSNPVVRLIREVKMTLDFGVVPIPQVAFFVNTKFYPFSGRIAGGASLDPDSLQKEYPVSDIYIEMDLLRQSWDLSEQAVQMQFYNSYNEGINIDGIPDKVDKTIDMPEEKPIREWMMVSGEQGTMFTHVEFQENKWKTVELYYHDDKTGGFADSAYVIGQDTGDKKSFGEHGLLFRTIDPNSPVNLSLDFNGYFLPALKDYSFAKKVAAWVEHPVKIEKRVVSGVAEQTNFPYRFKLYQNYPNPFNGHTKIVFSSKTRQNIRIRVLDINGRIVKTIADKTFAPGNHEFTWPGDSEHYSVSSGVYFIELQSNNQTQRRKMILIR